MEGRVHFFWSRVRQLWTIALASSADGAPTLPITSLLGSNSRPSHPILASPLHDLICFYLAVDCLAQRCDG